MGCFGGPAARHHMRCEVGCGAQRAGGGRAVGGQAVCLGVLEDGRGEPQGKVNTERGSHTPGPAPPLRIGPALTLEGQREREREREREGERMIIYMFV